MSARKELV
jgi:small subunit ribosomal protein S16e